MYCLHGPGAPVGHFGLVSILCSPIFDSRYPPYAGIYRIPGSEPVVKDLLHRFLRGKGLPKLVQYDDIHVVASCLKHFLRKLKVRVERKFYSSVPFLRVFAVTFQITVSDLHSLGVVFW